MPSIIPATPEDAPELARKLLEHADSPDDVVTDTSGSRVAFVVSDELAAKAGFGTDDDDQDSEVVPADAPEVTEPPRSGSGSGEKVWRQFLTDNGVAIPETATQREDLIELWDAAQRVGG